VVEGPAVDSRSIAGSDIVKKISKPKPKVENFREERGKSALFKNLSKMREKLAKERGGFFFLFNHACSLL